MTPERCTMTTVASGGKRRCSRRVRYVMAVPREAERRVCLQHAEHLIFYYGATVLEAPDAT